MHTGNGVKERSRKTFKYLIITNLEDGLKLTKSVNRAPRVMRFTIHTGLKTTLFELHHGRKPRTKVTNIIRDRKPYLSNWSEMAISAAIRPTIAIYVSRYAEGESTKHIRARTKTEEELLIEGPDSPKKKNSVR